MGKSTLVTKVFPSVSKVFPLVTEVFTFGHQGFPFVLHGLPCQGKLPSTFAWFVGLSVGFLGNIWPKERKISLCKTPLHVHVVLGNFRHAAKHCHHNLAHRFASNFDYAFFVNEPL